MNRKWLWLLAPILLLLAVEILPLATGARTLFLRDVLRSHLALRATLAEGIRAGGIPLVDPLRAGGQPLAGNANVVAFYPDNLLLLFSSTLWQLNAHFWLHWLVALGAAIWLGRSWGLEREGAVAAGVAFAFSGFFLSQLNLYNAVAPVALAPAMAAAVLETGRGATRRRGLLLFGLALAFALLGGDPILAGIGVVAALAVGVARHGWKLPWTRLALASGCALLVASPQIVETLRILGSSYRGYWGYSSETQARSAADPRATVDLLLPLFFGRPDIRLLWGTRYFGGYPPLYFSLAPGWIALALGAVSLRKSPRSLLACGAMLGALVVTFSGGTPLPELLAALPGGHLLRFPGKLMLAATLIGSLLVGAGLDGALSGRRRRALSWALLAATLLGALLWSLLTTASPGLLAALPMEGLESVTVPLELTRWAGVALLSTLSAAAAYLAWRWLPRRSAAVALVAIHAATQLLLLRPMLATDGTDTYRARPELADHLPEGARVAHAGVGELFGPGWEKAAVGDRRTLWLARRAQAELFPFAGRPLGFGYELDIAPEGLDAFVTHAVALGMRSADDARRLAVLEALGVERVILFRELAPTSLGGRARLSGEYEIAGAPTFVYELLHPLPRAALFGSVYFAPTMNDAMAVLYDPRFDARAFAIVAGQGEPRRGPSGRVELRLDEPERIEAHVESEEGGFLVLRRAHLSIWRARIDGREVPTRIAQATRLAVEVPPGEHQVVFVVSRAPLRWAYFGALLGLVGLVLVVGARWR